MKIYKAVPKELFSYTIAIYNGLKSVATIKPSLRDLNVVLFKIIQNIETNGLINSAMLRNLQNYSSPHLYFMRTFEQKEKIKFQSRRLDFIVAQDFNPA